MLFPRTCWEASGSDRSSLPLVCCRTAATGSSGQMLQSALRRWLEAGDGLLGPWQMGRDPLERALHSFEGVAGGPAVQPWQAGSRRGIGYAMEEGSSGSNSGATPGGAWTFGVPAQKLMCDAPANSFYWSWCCALSPAAHKLVLPLWAGPCLCSQMRPWERLEHPPSPLPTHSPRAWGQHCWRRS